MDILRTEKLNKRVSDTFSLQDINIQINEGEFVSLIGKNGAGKTTLLRVLSGLSKFDSGKVTICDIPISKRNKVNQYLGIIQQAKGLPDTLTVKEYINFQCRMRKGDPAMLEQLVDILDIKQFYNQYLSSLSGGNLRKIHIIIAIVHKPKIVIMDEPTAGLDPVVRCDMWNFIKGLKQLGISALISTHYLDEADNLADNLIILNEGKVVSTGKTEDIKKEYLKDHGLTLEFDTPAQAARYAGILQELQLPFVKTVANELNYSKVNTDAPNSNYLYQLSKLAEQSELALKGISFYKLTLEDILLVLKL